MCCNKRFIGGSVVFLSHYFHNSFIDVWQQSALQAKGVQL